MALCFSKDHTSITCFSVFCFSISRIPSHFIAWKYTSEYDKVAQDSFVFFARVIWQSTGVLRGPELITSWLSHNWFYSMYSLSFDTHSSR